MNHQTYSRRRGNAIVLAASILVLLVIIATTFVSRTQTARRTASAVQRDAAARTRLIPYRNLLLPSFLMHFLFGSLMPTTTHLLGKTILKNSFLSPRVTWSSDI